MNDNRRQGGGRQQGAGRQQGGGGGSRPWNLLLIREYRLKDDDPDSDPRADFLRVGHGFKGPKGFTIEPYVDLRRGDRLTLMPPTDEGER
jgi:hypothetical protein